MKHLVPYDFQFNGIFYNILDENSVEVTYGSSVNDEEYNVNGEYSGSLVISATASYNDKTYHVTAIGNNAFRDCKKLTNVIIPDSVIAVNDRAFDNCENLIELTIPNSVTTIGNRIFRGCTSLNKPLYNAHTFIFLPFNHSGNFVIPKGIKTIANSAFMGCGGLTQITIPDTVITIGPKAFSCCNLTTITLPNSVTTIGNNAFYPCFKITAPVYNKHVFACLPKGYEGSFIIPDGIKVIGSHAFTGCAQLTAITLPDSVTTIGTEAFHACFSLTDVTIPRGVIHIGGGAFAYCKYLSEITCLAPQPPIMERHYSEENEALAKYSFNYKINHLIPLYVPVESIEAYKSAPIWKEFKYIKPIRWHKLKTSWKKFKRIPFVKEFIVNSETLPYTIIVVISILLWIFC